jgi:hypothetical protein
MKGEQKWVRKDDKHYNPHSLQSIMQQVENAGNLIDEYRESLL